MIVPEALKMMERWPAPAMGGNPKVITRILCKLLNKSLELAH